MPGPGIAQERRLAGPVGDQGERFVVAYEAAGNRAYDLLRALLRSAGPRDGLEAALDELAAAVARHPGSARKLLLEVHGAGQAATTARHALYDRFARMLDRAWDTNTQSDEREPTTRAAFAVGAVDGVFSSALTNGRQDDLKTVVPELVDTVEGALEPRF